MMTDKAVYFSQSLLQILCFFLRLPHFSVSLDNGIEQGENIVFVDFQPEIRAFLWVFSDVGVELDRSSGDPALGIIGGLDWGDKLPIFFHSWRTTYLHLSPPYGHPILQYTILDILDARRRAAAWIERNQEPSWPSPNTDTRRGAAASPDIPRGGLASRTNIAKLRSNQRH